MTSPGGLDIWRVIFHVQIHDPLQTELPVFNDDRVFALRNAIDGSVECPVKDDARRFAAKARVIISYEISCGFFSRLGQFASAVETRACSGAASSRAATTAGIGRPLSEFVLAQLIELHHTAT